MPQFPSVEWFESVRGIVNENPKFRALGNIDTNVGVKVGDQIFLLNFEAFECASVSESDEDGLQEVDFYIEMTPEEWQNFLGNIKENAGADAQHTLNTMDLNHPGGIIRSRDEYLRHNFFRYLLSLQFFFDSSKDVETVYA